MIKRDLSTCNEATVGNGILLDMMPLSRMTSHQKKSLKEKLLKKCQNICFSRDLYGFDDTFHQKYTKLKKNHNRRFLQSFKMANQSL